MKYKQGFALIDFLMIIAIIGVLLTVVFALIGLRLETTAGEHTGYVTAVERTGVIWQTYDAYVKTNTQSSQEEKYCVIDPSLVEKLKSAQENKENITIIFGHGHWVPVWNCGVSFVDVITGIK